MPSHSDRVRRNYPEGVPEYGAMAPTRLNMRTICLPGDAAQLFSLMRFSSLAQRQHHLPEAAAAALRNNLWELYDDGNPRKEGRS
jgi:hypothetical protein